VLIVFVATIFLSALLLFLVQPMVGRMVLPVLGGTPAVWNTCMVFFQTLLLIGYLYAHLLTKYLTTRAQAVVHGVVVLVPLLLLPIALRKNIEVPTNEFPVAWLLGTLGTMAAAPFLVLSTTGPLIQRWFSATDHPRAKDPYFLYAASNAGSLIALLGYPALAEPLLRLREQSVSWAWGYGALALLLIWCAVLRVRRGVKTEATPTAGATSATDSAAGEVISARGAWRERATWVVLALAPSSLMIGATTYISTDLAPVPLLWIVPLSIYLVTMIVAYGSFGPIATGAATALLPVALVALAVFMQLGQGQVAWLHLPLHLAVFTIGAMACHGRLAARRPGPNRLTEYFLIMSLGGALGGVFNAIVAPLVFDRLLEYPIAIVLTGAAAMGTAGGRLWKWHGLPAWCRGVVPPAAWVVSLALGGLLLATSLTATIVGGASSTGELMLKLIVPCACGVVLLAAGCSARSETELWRRLTLNLVAPLSVLALFLSMEFVNGVLGLSGRLLGVAVQLGVTGMACLMLAPWAWRFTGAVAILLTVGLFSRSAGSGVLLTERSFFGVHRVQLMAGGGIELMHGTTTHGCQLRIEGKELMPTSYYHPTGPAGEVFSRLNAVGRISTVGIVGLGTGALAPYAQSGQTFTFFEIDPVVVRIAQNPEYFTFLSRCKGLVRLEVGDGRLLMAKSQDTFDVIVVDAFSSDSIPLHLITVEAMAMYAEKLRPRGVLLMHTSNRHLLLAGVVAGNAGELGLTVRRKIDVPTEQQAKEAKAPSEWLALSRRPEDLEFLSLGNGWEGPDVIAGWTKLRVWTDDFSNILGVYSAP